MKKKIGFFALLMILMVAFCGTAMAMDQPIVNDQAGLLTLDEKQKLTDKAQEITSRYGCTTAILTVDSLEGKTATEYADDYYDYNSMGTGEAGDGILLLISMEDRDWAISTTGYGITAFTDYGQSYMMDAVLNPLSNGDYYGAFDTYLNKCDELLEMAGQGTPLDGNGSGSSEKTPAQRLLSPMRILGCLLVGFLLALIPLGRLKKQVRNVAFQRSATQYEEAGSLQITRESDVFLYRNVTRVPIPKDNDKGGGSSIHVGSSGMSHGGSSGKF